MGGNLTAGIPPREQRGDGDSIGEYDNGVNENDIYLDYEGRVISSPEEEDVFRAPDIELLEQCEGNNKISLQQDRIRTNNQLKQLKQQHANNVKTQRENNLQNRGGAAARGGNTITGGTTVPTSTNQVSNRDLRTMNVSSFLSGVSSGFESNYFDPDHKPPPKTTSTYYSHTERGLSIMSGKKQGLTDSHDSSKYGSGHTERGLSIMSGKKQGLTDSHDSSKYGSEIEMAGGGMSGMAGSTLSSGPPPQIDRPKDAPADGDERLINDRNSVTAAESYGLKMRKRFSIH